MPREVPLVVTGDAPGHWVPALVGGKGAGLFWMNARGVPVPPFFAITTEAWRRWRTAGTVDSDLAAALGNAMVWLQDQAVARHTPASDALFVSVRSSGPASMPGMMDTVLNLRPGDLGGAVEQIFASWDNERARLYRKLRGIGDETGTAVVVQTMVFGNIDAESGTGVLFTRDPRSGTRNPTGEWLAQAQGEDLVSGRVTPDDLTTLAVAMPQTHGELVQVGQRLETDDRHPQDIEFTVERGRLFVLQTRRLKLTPLAACRVTIDLLDEGLLSEDEAVRRLDEIDLDHLGSESVDDGLVSPAAAGAPAAPGVARGRVCRDVRTAIVRAETGEPVVLVRPETTPNDLAGMRAAVAIVTEQGGTTSHAAIVARELGVPCVVGCTQAQRLREDAPVTVDGTTGKIYDGDVPSRRHVPAFVDQALWLRRQAAATTEMTRSAT